MDNIRNVLRALDYTELRVIARAHDIKRDAIEDFIDGAGPMPEPLADWYATHRLRAAVTTATPARVAEVTGIDAQTLADFTYGATDLTTDQRAAVEAYQRGEFATDGGKWVHRPASPPATAPVGVMPDRITALGKPHPHPLGEAA